MSVDPCSKNWGLRWACNGWEVTTEEGFHRRKSLLERKQGACVDSDIPIIGGIQDEAGHSLAEKLVKGFDSACFLLLL